MGAWLQRLLFVVAVLGLLLGVGVQWVNSRQANLQYLFRPLTLELDQVITSDDGTLTIRLERLTLRGTELRVSAVIEQQRFEDWWSFFQDVYLVNLSQGGTLDYGSYPEGFSGVNGPDSTLLMEWRFPYAELNAKPGDQLAFVLNSFSLARRFDRGQQVQVADLQPASLPADLPVGRDIIYRILAVDWDDERGGTRFTALYVPGPALEGKVSGYRPSKLQIPKLQDQRGEEYRSLDERLVGHTGHPWLFESRFERIDPTVATELTFLFDGIDLWWEGSQTELSHAIIDLPRR